MPGTFEDLMATEGEEAFHHVCAACWLLLQWVKSACRLDCIYSGMSWHKLTEINNEEPLFNRAIDLLEDFLPKIVIIHSCTPTTCISSTRCVFIQNPSPVQPEICSSHLLCFIFAALCQY